MKNFLGVDKTLPALEKSFKAATKLKGELPTDLGMESIPLEEVKKKYWPWYARIFRDW